MTSLVKKQNGSKCNKTTIAEIYVPRMAMGPRELSITSSTRMCLFNTECDYCEIMAFCCYLMD